MSFRLVPKSVTLNGLERRSGRFRYFTEFGKPVFQHVTALISCGGIHARVCCIFTACTMSL